MNNLFCQIIIINSFYLIKTFLSNCIELSCSACWVQIFHIPLSSILPFQLSQFWRKSLPSLFQLIFWLIYICTYVYVKYIQFKHWPVLRDRCRWPEIILMSKSEIEGKGDLSRSCAFRIITWNGTVILRR